MDVDYEMQGQDKIVISRKDFENMLDLIAYDEAKLRDKNTVPVEMTLNILQGESPLKTFRKHKKISQAELSKLSGVPQGLISEIETGKKQGSVASLIALAKILDTTVDDLI